MNTEERLRNRVDANAVGKILQTIAVTPNRRDRPRTGDLSGNFDFWFDGGAARMITGWTEFEFADGTRARVDVVPGLQVVVQFKNGYGAVISQLDPNFDIGGFFQKDDQQRSLRTSVVGEKSRFHSKCFRSTGLIQQIPFLGSSKGASN